MSMRGLIMALVVVLAAVVVFWLTGDRGKEPGQPTEASAPAKAEDADARAKARTSTGESPAKASPRAGGAELDPSWKQKLRDGEGSEDKGRPKTDDRLRKTPHAPGPPQR